MKARTVRQFSVPKDNPRGLVDVTELELGAGSLGTVFATLVGRSRLASFLRGHQNIGRRADVPPYSLHTYDLGGCTEAVGGNGNEANGDCWQFLGSVPGVLRRVPEGLHRAVLGQNGLKTPYNLPNPSGRPKRKMKKSCALSGRKFMGVRISPPKVPQTTGHCIFPFSAQPRDFSEFQGPS